MQGDQDAGADAADPDQPPESQEEQDCRHISGGGLPLARVSTMRPNSSGPNERRAGERDVGKAESQREAPLGREQRQNAAVERKKVHPETRS